MSTSMVIIILTGLFSYFSPGQNPLTTEVKTPEELPSQNTKAVLSDPPFANKGFVTAYPHDHIHSDSFIDGEKLMLNLSVDELEKLGFVFSDTGVYYKNFYQGEYSFFCSIGRGMAGTWGLRENIDSKIPVHSGFNFYPVYITNNSYDVSYESLRKAADFEMLNDTLVPVRVTEEQSKGVSDLIFWFVATNDLFKHLPSDYFWLEEKYNSIKEMKNSGSEKNLVEFVPVPVITASRYIELSQYELEKLGFLFTYEAVSYIFTLTDNMVKLSLNDGNHMEILGQNEKWGFDKAVFNFNQEDESKVKTPFKLFFISDSYGNQPFIWTIKPGDENKLKSSYFKKKIDYLVPVVIRKKNYPFLRTDFIFWFEPNEALFDSFPESIGNAIEKEYKYITTPTEQRKEAPECEYFNACHPPLYKDFKVFPNPVISLACINFTSEHTTVGRIELLDINGKKLKTLASHLNIKKGMNSCEIDLCDRTPGIYMLLLVIKKDYQVQRVIVAR